MLFLNSTIRFMSQRVYRSSNITSCFIFSNYYLKERVFLEPFIRNPLFTGEREFLQHSVLPSELKKKLPKTAELLNFDSIVHKTYIRSQIFESL